ALGGGQALLILPAQRLRLLARPAGFGETRFDRLAAFLQHLHDRAIKQAGKQKKEDRKADDRPHGFPDVEQVAHVTAAPFSPARHRAPATAGSTVGGGQLGPPPTATRSHFPAINRSPDPTG